MKRKIHGVYTALFCTALAIGGCSPSQKEQESETAEPQPQVTEEPRQEPEILSEEEQIRAVYENGLDMTFCIFTPDGNNGTGFLYNGKYVITNAHVLYDTDTFTLMDHEGNEYTGTVVFTDDAEDIAIIKAAEIKGTSVTIGSSDEVKTGDMLVMIGNPADGEPCSFTSGKRVEVDEGLIHADLQKRYIPTDADLTSGYSGGPVFNLFNELVGISNAAFLGDLSQYEFDHLSLIIPVDRVIEEIEENCAD